MALLFGSDKTNITDFFGSNEKLERYIRYCVARFGAFNIIWEGRVEFEEEGSGAVALARKMGALVEKYDPYDHIQSMHTLDSNNELGNDSWLDWIMHQSRDWSLITSDRNTYQKPVMNEEFYYENSGAGATHSHHVDAETVRKGAWHVMMAGATGLAFGNTGTLNARTQYWKGLSYADSDGARYMTYLYNFFVGTRFVFLSPDAGEDNLLKNPGKEYVAYFETGGTRTITLEPGSYHYRWYNPGNGTYQTEKSVSGGSRIFSAPDSNDWILHVFKTTLQAPSGLSIQ